MATDEGQDAYRATARDRDLLVELMRAIEYWTRDHPNGTCEAVNTKILQVLGKLTKPSPPMR